jgi:uncharacterized small protein (DUF1192 family)
LFARVADADDDQLRGQLQSRRLAASGEVAHAVEPRDVGGDAEVEVGVEDIENRIALVALVIGRRKADLQFEVVAEAAADAMLSDAATVVDGVGHGGLRIWRWRCARGGVIS